VAFSPKKTLDPLIVTATVVLDRIIEPIFAKGWKMVWVWAGYAAIAVAVIWIFAKMYVAYGSAGGTVMVVVYDAVVYPPIVGTVGLYFVLSYYQVKLAFWIYLIIWGVTAGITFGAIRLMEEIGDRPL
jgi:hypothetical protein